MVSPIDEALGRESERLHAEMAQRHAGIIGDIVHERLRQDVKWGPQVHPDGTSEIGYGDKRDYYRSLCESDAAYGESTWFDILLEEVFESGAESDPAKLRKELIQSAAVIVAWVENIDNRG